MASANESVGGMGGATKTSAITAVPGMTGVAGLLLPSSLVLP